MRRWARLPISARTSEKAWTLGDLLAHDTDCWHGCSDEHPWSHADGSTASKLSEVRELSEVELTVAKDVIGLQSFEAEYQQNEIDVNNGFGPSA